VIHEVPDLRIIDRELWEDAKERQKRFALGPTEPGENPLTVRRRPTHLLAGLMRCGCCGGAYTLISKDLLGCATARNRGTCNNRLNIRRDALEASVVSGLRTHLMEPELFKEFCEEFTRTVNRGRMDRRAEQDVWRTELDRINRELGKLLQALKAGGSITIIVEEMKQLQARKVDLSERLANAGEEPPLLHPTMGDLYRERIATLHARLQDEPAKAEAIEVLRQLVDKVTLIPENGELAIVLRGDLAAILSRAAGKKKPVAPSAAGCFEARWARKGKGDPAGSPSPLSQESLVAGIGFEPMTFRL
jgi:site-specific DNA recombinase